MKRLVFILLLISNTVFGQSKYDGINFFDYLNKSISDPKIQEITNGWDPEEMDFSYYLTDEEEGVSFCFTKDKESIRNIQVTLLSNNVQLPYGISVKSSINDLNQILGTPDRILHTKDDLMAISKIYWDRKGIVIDFDYDQVESGVYEIQTILISEPK
jgi:hypothetical protein